MIAETLKKMQIEDGDILLHTPNAPSESKILMDALKLIHPNKKVLLITNYDSKDVLTFVDDELLLEINEMVLKQLIKRGLNK